MNLLAKDKYRTKILQHVLQQSENSSLEDYQNDAALDRHFDNLENIKNHCQNIYSSVMFEKVAKQKPLISDIEDAPSLIQVNQRKKKMFDKQTLVNPNYHIDDPAHKSQPKQSTKPTQKQQKEALNFFNEPRSTVHLHKQPYTYHQKLPIMSFSNNSNEDFLKRIKGDLRQKKTINDNKENNPKDMNSFKEKESKGKKYRFIPAFKVAEVELKKEQDQRKDKVVFYQLNEKTTNEDQIVKDEENTTDKFDETHRSKGSREMMDFLESARDKLFSNMKSLQTIELEKDEKQLTKNITNYGCNQQRPNLNQQENTMHIPLSQPTFKIQIEVSAKKSCQLNLTLTSDPEKISKAFILSNKQQLSTFTDTQIKKLQELLSKKIQNEIAKQKSFYETQKGKENVDKIGNNIEQTRENEVLIRQAKERKQITANNEQNIYNRKENEDLQKKKLTKKSLQCSHVYIENIENSIDEPSEEKPQSKNLTSTNPTLSPKQTLPLTKLISFNPKTSTQAFEETSKQQISLDGYLNSPHQLITYRPESSHLQSNDMRNQSLNDSNCLNNQNIQKQVSHFPISASISDAMKSKAVIETDQIGASKILSKSRSKLIHKIKKQQDHQQNVISQNQIPSQPQTMLPPSQPSPSHNPASSKSPRNNSNTLSATSRTINPISSQIVSRVGKQKIIESLKLKELNKREMIMKQKQAKENELLQECSFKPKINKVSKSIDENKRKKIKIGDLVDEGIAGARMRSSSFFRQKPCELMIQNQPQAISNQTHKNEQSINPASKLTKSNYFFRQKPRHQQLYANHKQIKARKQYSRQKSIEQISFKPQINKISKKIMETKRNSLNNSTCHDMSQSVSRHHSTCKKPQQKRNSLHCVGYEEDTTGYNYHGKRKSMNVSRNLQGLEIGDYLYKEAMRMIKKKQNLQQQVKMDSFRPLEKSEQIVNKVKETRLTECFYELLNVTSQQSCNEYEFLLKPQCINLEDDKFTKTHLRYLVPLLEQLKELDASLTLVEFIQSGLNLLNHLSQDQKAEFLSKKPFFNESQTPEPVIRPQMNKVSRQLIEKKPQYLQDIYHRGVVYKKQIKDKREMDMEDRVRRELEKCTFKPKINVATGGASD